MLYQRFPFSQNDGETQALATVTLGAEDDAQFETALKQAIIWGKWEPLVQHLVIEAGLTAWYQLPQSTRWLVLAAIERGIFLQPQLIKALINKYQRIYTLCAYLDLYKEHPGFANTFSIDRQPIQLSQFCQQTNFGETRL